MSSRAKTRRPRRDGVGARRVLVPLKRKAVRHPWAIKHARILAAHR